FRVSASPELHLVGLIHFVTQDLSAARADKGIVRVGVKDQYQIREVVNKAACEFLLLVEAALHLTALGDIDERALSSKDSTGIVARKNGDAADLAPAHHVVGHAIKKERRGLVFQPDRNNTGPLAALHETRHGTLHQP